MLKSFCDLELRWVEFTLLNDLGADGVIIEIAEGNTKTKSIVNRSVVDAAIDFDGKLAQLERRSFYVEEVATECDCCGADNYDYVIKPIADSSGDWVSARQALTRIAELERLLIVNNIDLPE